MFSATQIQNMQAEANRLQAQIAVATTPTAQTSKIRERVGAQSNRLAPLTGKETSAQLLERIALLEKQAATPQPIGITLGIGESGCLCLYGFQKRYPINLYANVLEWIFANQMTIKAFMAKHADKLSRKATK